MTDAADSTNAADDAGLRDYRAWHEAYERPGSALHLRLMVVRDLVADALEAAPSGPIRVLSLCAGIGADLVPVARRHRRAADVRGRLVELDPHNVAQARASIAQAGLDGLEVLEGDAGLSDAAADAVPADLVLVCGVFGNIPDPDIDATIAFLPRLVGRGGRVLWTRRPEPADRIDRIRAAFDAAGFQARSLVVDDEGRFAVGAEDLVGEPAPFEPGRRLFQFVR